MGNEKDAVAALWDKGLRRHDHYRSVDGIMSEVSPRSITDEGDSRGLVLTRADGELEFLSPPVWYTLGGYWNQGLLSVRKTHFSGKYGVFIGFMDLSGLVLEKEGMP